MLWRRDDQLERVSDGFQFGKSKEMLGGRIPMGDRSMSIHPDDCRHSRYPFADFHNIASDASGVQKEMSSVGRLSFLDQATDAVHRQFLGAM